jgi:type IV secretory pathway VirJ component
MTPIMSTIRARARAVRRTWRIVVVLGFAGLVGCRGDHSEAPPAPPVAKVSSPTTGEVPTVADLPLIEVPASGTGSTFAVMLTGDGGWAPADRAISNALAAHGIPVAGLSSPRYLASARSPDELSRDLGRILRHYITAWGRSRIVVIGYSRGADLAPFVVSRLPDDLRRRITLVALLGPSAWAGFEFHLVDLVTTIHREGDLPVAPEIGRLRGTAILCIYGRRDRDAICHSLDRTLARPIRRDGGHVIAGREGAALADTIVQALGDTR